MAGAFKKTGAPSVGDKYIMAIGINAYTHLSPINSAVNDAKSIDRLFVEEFHYTRVTEPFVDKKATKANINHLVVNELGRKLKEDDTLVFFFAGHGEARDIHSGDHTKGYLAPIDAKEDNWDSFIEMSTLLSKLSDLDAGNIFVILDTCYSGQSLGSLRIDSHNKSDKKSKNRRLLTSAGAFEEAVDSFSGASLVNSPFTALLLDVLQLPKGAKNAKADIDGDGFISVAELCPLVQVEFRARYKNSNRYNFKQMPLAGFFATGGTDDFIIAKQGTGIEGRYR